MVYLIYTDLRIGFLFWVALLQVSSLGAQKVYIFIVGIRGGYVSAEKI